jgi:hypothetical protein
VQLLCLSSVHVITLHSGLTVKAGIRGGQTERLSGAPAYKGRQDVTGIIGNMLPVDSVFHMQKSLSDNYPKFGLALSKIFAGPVLSLKEFQF